jgi:hypothetical protein
MKPIAITTIIALTMSAFLHAAAPTPSAEVVDRVDWGKFLARQDLTWTQAPTEWFDAPFLGNGFIGTMLYQNGARSLRFDIGRGDAYDHRKGGNAWTNRSRLPIGYFTLDTLGAVKSFAGRLDLWNAEFTGEVTTEKGTIRLRAFAHATQMVMAFDIQATGGEQACRLTWHPEQAVASARAWAIDALKSQPDNVWAKRWATMKYPPHPPLREGREGDIAYCYQPLLEGGETTTAWTISPTGPGGQRLLVSVIHTYPHAAAKAKAIAAVRTAAATEFDAFIRTHRDWWHAYYPASFVSIPDPYWEQYYWLQMYKLACVTRVDGPLIDQMGPWYRNSAWPCAWFNLNVQLTYWCVGDANRLEYGESLIGRFDKYRGNLVANMPKEFGGQCAGLYTVVPQDLTSPWVMQSLGDLPWAMHNYWMMLRRSMDERRMREQFFPLLKQTINTYLRLLKPGPDGRLHIASTFSPEYGHAPDTNYNLALLRWGCQTLVELCERYHIKDPLLPKWKNVLAKLVDYPTDKNGFMIGAGMPFAKAHRHYSHLLMVYPLRLVTVDQPGGRELIAKSLRHWLSFGANKPGDCSGYSWTGASCMASALGDGNLALEYLNGLRQPLVAKRQGLSRTTMYRESEHPCQETPFSGAQSIHEMLIQSWGGTIRVFPACPTAWRDAEFRDLRAEGAFLVSAVRKDGKTQWVRIKSLAGEPCRVWINGKAQQLRLAKGEEIVITDGRPRWGQGR